MGETLVYLRICIHFKIVYSYVCQTWITTYEYFVKVFTFDFYFLKKRAVRTWIICKFLLSCGSTFEPKVPLGFLGQDPVYRKGAVKTPHPQG